MDIVSKLSSTTANESGQPESEKLYHQYEHLISFDLFPCWKRRDFILTLIDALGGVNSLHPAETHLGIVLFARKVFYERATKRELNLPEYHQFCNANPNYRSPDSAVLKLLYDGRAQLPPNTAQLDIANWVIANANIDMFNGKHPSHFLGVPNPSVPVPAWQLMAPSQPLRRTENTGSSAGPGVEQAPYPTNFEQIIRAVQNQEQVEDIRDIPDTIARVEGVAPKGARNVPLKPWEVARHAHNGENNQNDGHGASSAPGNDELRRDFTSPNDAITT